MISFCKSIINAMRAILLLVGLCALSSSAQQSTVGRSIPSRSKTLQKISGDVSEQILHMERCRQSSVSESCVFAIDGDINQEPWSNECSITTADMKPWWEARVEDPAYISKVQLYGVKQVSERGVDALTDFELIAGDHICIRYKSYSTFLNRTVSCDTYADFIRIQSNVDHAVLALCEVVVYGKNVKLSLKEKSGTQMSVATCLMSSTSSTSRCHLAIDNNMEQDWKQGSCALTESERTPWWEAKLAEPALIRKLRIYNRVDCCQNLLNNFEISVNGQLCYRFDREAAFSIHEATCGRFGDRIRIISAKVGETELPLCEVIIYGFPIELYSISNHKYIGCYHEKKKQRDLQSLVAINRMTTEKCERMCRRRSKPYFGLQQGQQCWCSERYGMYGRAAEDACWMHCDDNLGQACGAKLHNSVFQINELAAIQE